MGRRNRWYVAGLCFSLLPFGIWAVCNGADDPAAQPSPKAQAESLTKAKKDARRYIRVPKDAHGDPISLETAITHFVPAGDENPGLKVDLISAVHVGEPEYYEALNKRFENYDVLLYELVAPEGTVIPKGGGPRSRNPLSAMQNGIKDLLDLEYQLAGVDYTKKNFVHADLSPEEFAKSMESKGESFWTIFIRLMAAGMAQQATNPGKSNEFELLMALFDPQRALKLKRVMADQFVDMDTVMLAFNGPDGSTLITERNKAALKVLDREIKNGNKKIAIFYGGGHMPDMEDRLISDFKLKRDGEEWLEAWNLRDPAHEKAVSEVKRNMDKLGKALMEYEKTHPPAPEK